MKRRTDKADRTRRRDQLILPLPLALLVVVIALSSWAVLSAFRSRDARMNATGVSAKNTLSDRNGAEHNSRAAAHDTNIVIFLIDTLRADRLGAYGFDKSTSPNMDALAGESVLFAQAYTPAPWTLPTVVSLITSTWPCGSTVRNTTDRTRSRGAI